MRSIYTIYRCSWTFYDVLHLSTRAHKVHMTLLWAFSSHRDWALVASHSTQSWVRDIPFPLYLNITSNKHNLCLVETGWRGSTVPQRPFDDNPKKWRLERPSFPGSYRTIPQKFSHMIILRNPEIKILPYSSRQRYEDLPLLYSNWRFKNPQRV